MIYLTQTRLMLESEQSVEGRASSGDAVAQRICSQLLADDGRYSLWHARHEGHMGVVAGARQRERQILSLRTVSVEQIHRSALVRHLRDQGITGAARDQTLREFYGVMDPREATITEHRHYLLASSTQFCAADILAMIGDHMGVELLRRYEFAYTQYFGLFCERARARHMGTPYLLAMLMPEVRDSAEQLRARIMDTTRVAPVSTAAARVSAAKSPVKKVSAVKRLSEFFHPRP